MLKLPTHSGFHDLFLKYAHECRRRLMIIFNNISVLSWWLVLLLEEMEVTSEN